MAFWVFMLCCDLIIPVMMLLLGQQIERHPPRDINALVGCRTRRSMRNQDTWQFAHRVCGRLWRRAGWPMLALSALAMLLLLGRDTGTVGTWGGVLCGVQTAALLATIPAVERKLRRNFDDFGRRTC